MCLNHTAMCLSPPIAVLIVATFSITCLTKCRQVERSTMFTIRTAMCLDLLVAACTAMCIPLQTQDQMITIRMIHTARCCTRVGNGFTLACDGLWQSDMFVICCRSADNGQSLTHYSGNSALLTATSRESEGCCNTRLPDNHEQMQTCIHLATIAIWAKACCTRIVPYLP
jgi:hypothetical protein